MSRTEIGLGFLYRSHIYAVAVIIGLRLFVVFACTFLCFVTSLVHIAGDSDATIRKQGNGQENSQEKRYISATLHGMHASDIPTTTTINKLLNQTTCESTTTTGLNQDATSLHKYAKEARIIKQERYQRKQGIRIIQASTAMMCKERNGDQENNRSLHLAATPLLDGAFPLCGEFNYDVISKAKAGKTALCYARTSS